jgi:hypothetical protein
VNLTPALLARAGQVALDFGPGTPTEPNLQETPGMHALLDSPVREAAVIVVNGKRAGVIWHPPYQVNIASYLHAGQNQIGITVGNLAINEMSGQPTPSYRLLNLRYGERFIPQDVQDLRPLPAGILRSVTLKAE